MTQPLTPEKRAELIRSFDYFWSEYGDIERCTAFDRDMMQREFPGVLKAWDDYKHAERVMKLVIHDEVYKVEGELE